MRRRPVVLAARGRGRDQGILVSGADGPNCPRRSSARVHKPLVAGFTLRGFRDGVILRCTDGFRLARLRVLASRRHGVTVWRSVSGRIDHSAFGGAGRSGVHLAESRGVRIDHNRARRAVGGFQIENSRSVRVDHNLAALNTAGILSLALPGRAVRENSAIRLDHNRVIENNRPNGCLGQHEVVCKVRPGSGLLVLAGDRSRAEANMVLRNRSFGIAVTSYCGGLGLQPARCRGLDVDPHPDGNLVASNLVRGNGTPAGSSRASWQTVDLGWDQTGTGNCWRANGAGHTFPPTLPDCEPLMDDCRRGTTPDCAVVSRAPVEVGVGEQGMSLFADPLFAELGVSRARIMVPWNLPAIPVELSYVADWLAAARRAGVEPFVQFTRATNSRCPSAPCSLPTVAEYAAAFRDFRERFPWVTVLGIWNEANHPSQPTSRDPSAAAGYYRAARALCPDCEIVAADVLDSANMEAWVAEFQRHAGEVDIWGLHNYADANLLPDLPANGTARFLSVTSGEVWLTETGGIVRRRGPALGDLPYDEERAARAAGRAFDLAALYRSRVSRMYLYNWRASPPGDRWDSGLERRDGSPRPAYFMTKAELQTPDFRP
jgi:hypothetical protein